MLKFLAHIVFLACLLLSSPLVGQQRFHLEGRGAAGTMDIQVTVRSTPPGVQVSSGRVRVLPSAAGEALQLSLRGEGVESWVFQGGSPSFFRISETSSPVAIRTSQRISFASSLGSETKDLSDVLRIEVEKAGDRYVARLPIMFDAPEPDIPEEKPDAGSSSSVTSSSGQSTVSSQPAPRPEPPTVESDQQPEEVKPEEEPSSNTPDMTSDTSSTVPGAPASGDDKTGNGTKTVTIDILAWAKNHPVYLLAGFIVLLGLIVLLRMSRRRKVHEVVVKDPAPPSDTMSKEKNQQEEENLTNDDLGISFEEAELGEGENLPPVSSLLQHPHYILLDLTEHWEDTAVPTFLVQRDCVAELDQTIRLPINRQKSEETPDDVPEIGGFLLGRFEEMNDHQYIVVLEKFLSITPSAQNRYTVQFGDQAWMELEEAFKEYPGLKLVGWFHTHPGHGLFLSSADLREHRALFQRRYQVAMEIDPLTEDLDLAVFTWSTQADLNNEEQRITDSWFSFIDDLDKPSRRSFETPS